MREYAIAAIPGDGIGTEVIAAGLQVLRVLEEKAGGFRLKVEHFPWGSDYYKKHGVMMPRNGLDMLRPFRAIYFGAVGAPDVPDDVTLWGLRLAICQGFDQYVNLRPTRIGRLCGKTRKGSTRGREGERIAGFRKKLLRRQRFSRAVESRGSCGLRFNWHGSGRGSC